MCWKEVDNPHGGGGGHNNGSGGGVCGSLL